MVMDNLLGITDSTQLAREEERISKQKAVEMLESGYLDSLKAGTFESLSKIHEYLFSEIYDFAGKVRDVNLAKGGFRFTPVMYLEVSLKHIEEMPQRTIDEIIEKYVEMNAAHPFREGNGRSTRIWLDLILKQELHQVIDWSKVDKEDYLLAMERSPIRDVEIKALLKKALTDEIHSAEIYKKGIDHSYYYEGYIQFKIGEEETHGSVIRNKKQNVDRIVPVFGIISTIVVAFYAFAQYGYNLRYGNLSEKFYSIPAYYFSKSIDDSILYIGVLIFIFLMPCVVSWTGSKKQSALNFRVTTLIGSLYGLALGCINLNSLIKICQYSDSIFWKFLCRYLNNHAFLSILGVMVISIMATSFLALAFSLPCSIHKTATKVWLFVTSICVVFSLMIAVEGMKYIVESDPALKTEYEIAVCDDEKYAVLTEYEGKLLVVPMYGTEEEIKFDTKNYFFVDRDACKFSVKNFDQVPIIGEEDMN